MKHYKVDGSLRDFWGNLLGELAEEIEDTADEVEHINEELKRRYEAAREKFDTLSRRH